MFVVLLIRMRGGCCRPLAAENLVVSLRRNPCLFASVEGTSGGEIAMAEMLAYDADTVWILAEIKFCGQMPELMAGDRGPDVLPRARGDRPDMVFTAMCLVAGGKKPEGCRDHTNGGAIFPVQFEKPRRLREQCETERLAILDPFGGNSITQRVSRPSRYFRIVSPRRRSTMFPALRPQVRSSSMVTASRAQAAAELLVLLLRRDHHQLLREVQEPVHERTIIHVLQQPAVLFGQLTPTGCRLPHAFADGSATA